MLCSADVFPEMHKKNTIIITFFVQHTKRGRKLCKVPGYEECGVMMRGITVFLDILVLLPDTEVVKRRGSVKAHCGSFLFYVKHHIIKAKNVRPFLE